MGIDTRRIDDFLAQRPLRQQAGDVARRAGFEISWAEEIKKDRPSPPSWWIALKLNSRLREILGTAREVVMYAVESKEFQARTITQAKDIINSDDNRYSEDLAFILTNDPDTDRHVAESSAAMSTVYIGISDVELIDFLPFGKRDLIRHIQAAFFSRDQYLITTALPTRAGFFGRKELLNYIVTHLRTGQAHVGLFGLRKMGKTSVLFQIKNSLCHSPRTLVSHIDLQTISAVSHSIKRLLWAIGEGFLDHQPRLASRHTLRLIGKYRSPIDIPDEQSAWELFDHDMRALLSESDQNVVLLFDEIELMGPASGNPDWAASFVRVWRLLRGLSQQFPRRVAYFVAGTNPTLFETNQIGAFENPAYNLFQNKYLDRLNKQDCASLLVQIGQRMGLNWDSGAIAGVYDATGGHPFLTRLFASRIHHALLPRNNPRPVVNSDISERLDDYLGNANSFLAQMTEILQTQYQDEYLILEYLATGNLASFREYSRNFPDATTHLRGYGLIGDPNEATGLEIASLQSWMQNRNRLKSALAHTKRPGDQNRVGDEIENYRLEALVGSPGGFAQVYRAVPKNGGGGSVAVKIFHSASLAAVEREASVLQGLDHPGIVKILDYGRAPDGTVFLVMEYLSGPMLRKYCDRSRRLGEADVRKTLKGLLESLSYLHPNLTEVEELRQRDVLSDEELGKFQRKLHGYVHRDIKPENVIIESERGPVLIDFGISSRARDPINTISCTPGYLPTDARIGEWSPDVDLYQLGITILQASLGLPFFGEQSEIENLRTMCHAELPRDLARVICGLAADSQSERYSSAERALRDLAY